MERIGDRQGPPLVPGPGAGGRGVFEELHGEVRLLEGDRPALRGLLPHGPAAAGQADPEDRTGRPAGGGALPGLHQGPGGGRPHRPGDGQAHHRKIPEREENVI